jgi:hypothetical protein
MLVEKGCLLLELEPGKMMETAQHRHLIVK